MSSENVRPVAPAGKQLDLRHRRATITAWGITAG